MEITDFDKSLIGDPNDEFEPYNSKEFTPENEPCRIKYFVEPFQRNKNQELLNEQYTIIFPRSKKVKQLNGIDRVDTFYDPVYEIVYTIYYNGKFSIVPVYECQVDVVKQIEFHD